jgi:hypothetical protein
VAWFRGDDKSHSNPKLLAVELVGTGLYWRAVSWCADHETDGRLPASVVPSLSPELSAAVRKRLAKAMCSPLAPGRDPLWEVETDDDTAALAYWIHDYLVFNPSHEQLENKRQAEKTRIANKRGAT